MDKIVQNIIIISIVFLGTKKGIICKIFSFLFEVWS